MPPLILVATYACNLRCAHCPVPKSEKHLTRKTAIKAVSVYQKVIAPRNIAIKFAGGEPFTNFQVIRDVIRFAKRRDQGAIFSLSTNGTLIDKGIFAYLKARPDIEVWFSPHPASSRLIRHPLASLPNVGMNILITPGNVSRLPDFFLKKLIEGYVRFNFLPAYFTRWDQAHARMLARAFAAVALTLRLAAKNGLKITVKNALAFGTTPLFNDGFVVDHNGDVFSSNLILAKQFSSLRPKLKIGHVAQPAGIRWTGATDHGGFLKGALGARAYRATLAVDRILSDFCDALRPGN